MPTPKCDYRQKVRRSRKPVLQCCVMYDHVNQTKRTQFSVSAFIDCNEPDQDKGSERSTLLVVVCCGSSRAAAFASACFLRRDASSKNAGREVHLLEYARPFWRFTMETKSFPLKTPRTCAAIIPRMRCDERVVTNGVCQYSRSLGLSTLLLLPVLLLRFLLLFLLYFCDITSLRRTNESQ